MDDTHQGYLLKWQSIHEILTQEGACWTQTILPTLMLVHPSNRGGTGINSGSMHVKGAAIVKSGADLSHLGASCAFEMATHAEAQQAQLDFNAKLHQESQGMMAKPTGAERFLSVSSSHTSQFIKAIVAGAVTDQPSLKGPDGHLNPVLLRQDKTLHTMATVGWTWTIIAAHVEEAFPRLPSLIEKANNSTNCTFAHQNEVELMASLVDHVSTSAEASHDFERLAVDMCLGGQVATYAAIVGKFVHLYSGQVMK